MSTINTIIVQRMTVSVPTFSIDNTKIELETDKGKKRDMLKYRQKTRAEELCPCGSGMLYQECHGKYGIHTPRRRR